MEDTHATKDKAARDEGSLAPNGAYIAYRPGKPRDGLWEKMKSTPYVTTGVFCTTGILIVGIISMKFKKPLISNYIMRARVLSQAITLGFVMAATGALTWQGAKPAPAAASRHEASIYTETDADAEKGTGGE